MVSESGISDCSGELLGDWRLLWWGGNGDCERCYVVRLTDAGLERKMSMGGWGMGISRLETGQAGSGHEMDDMRKSNGGVRS